MQRVALGSGGPEVAQLGIGTWAWGDRLFWNYGSDYGPAEVRAAFEAAVAAGVDLFDTAEVYGLGESETPLGQCLRASNQPVKIATKYFPLPWRWSAEAVEEAVSASLKRLGVERLDLYQVHSPLNFFMSAETLMGALAREVKRGRIAAVGVSNYGAAQMAESHQLLAAEGVPLAVNQVRYSLLTREIEVNGVLDTARKLGVTILAYSPLAQGLLSGKYTASNPPSGARRLDSRYGAAGMAAIAPLLDLLRTFGKKYDRTPAQVALNWLICQPGVLPIPGAKTAPQARENAGALGWQLSGEDVQQLDQASVSWRKA